MNPPALPLGEERYTPTDGANIVSGDHISGSLIHRWLCVTLADFVAEDAFPFPPVRRGACKSAGLLSMHVERSAGLVTRGIPGSE